MAWTANRTWVTGEIPTAAIFNTYVRDNLDETCPATATTAGDIVYADGANSMGSRLAIGANYSQLMSDGSDPVWRTYGSDITTTAYTTLLTNATYTLLSHSSYFNYPAGVIAAATTGTRALVFVKGKLRSDTAGATTFLSFSVSGASTVSATDSRAVMYESSNANDQMQAASWFVQTGLTAGTNNFKLNARMTSGLSTLANVGILVLPL